MNKVLSYLEIIPAIVKSVIDILYMIKNRNKDYVNSQSVLPSSPS